MATKGHTASLSIPEISKAEGLSVPNVAKLMRLLRLGGFVKSVRGQAGGYVLSRPAAQIMVGPVLDSLGGRLFGSNFCTRHAGRADACVHLTDCGLRPLWSSLQQLVGTILDRTSLADLLRPEAEVQALIEIHISGKLLNGAAASQPLPIV
jgi:Rrf2 family protein